MDSVLRARLAKYIPPKDQWTPVDEALYGVDDIYNVPEEKAKRLRTNAIRYAFKHHYENNRFYHEYCKQNNVSPDDIKNEEDFKKIPLIPSSFFKDHPLSGPDFIKWLRNIYTGKLPEIELSARPTYDEIIEKLEEKGVIMTHSSGSTGEFTFIPRDQITFSRLVYAFWYPVNMYFGCDSVLIGLAPRGNLIASIVSRVIDKIFSKEYLPWDYTVKPSVVKEGGMIKDYDSSINQTVSYICNIAFSEKSVLMSAPAVVYAVLEKLFDSGCKPESKIGLCIVGGWGSWKGEKIEYGKFFEKSKKILGESFRGVLDLYSMSEMNVSIPFFRPHDYHIPYLLQPFVLDEEMQPLPYGSEGRFAFLDPTPSSYPGFIATDDKVKLLDHCPACDRPGPVIEPPITRMPGAEDRGCATVIGKLLQEI